MTLFTERELDYLQGHRLGRIATTGRAGEPHVVPVGYRVDVASGSLTIGQHASEGRGQDRLYLRQLRANPRAALVVDDVDTAGGWQPSGILVKGAVRFHDTDGEALGPGFGPSWIEIVPDHASSWGIDTHSHEPATPRHA